MVRVFLAISKQFIVVLCILLVTLTPSFRAVPAAEGTLASRGSRQIIFSGFPWDVRSGYGGPGPSYWSDSTDNVWLDNLGYLHMRITFRNGHWYSPEVIGPALGFGQYVFYTNSRLDTLDKNIVAGLFTYENDTSEMDIEFSRWGGLASTSSDYVVQPHHAFMFNIHLNGDFSTHRFTWTNESISFQSIHGHYSIPPSGGYLISEWQYAREQIPQTKAPRVHANLWLFQGVPPSDGKEVELIIEKFEFIPLQPTPSIS